MTRKYTVPRNGSVFPTGDGRVTRTLTGPLEKLTSITAQNSIMRNYFFFFSYLEFRKMDRVHKPSNYEIHLFVSNNWQ
jgi:hypothetical protein